MKPSILKIHSALLFVTVIYSANYVLAKLIMPEYIRAAGFILLRIIGALIILWLYHRIAVKEKVKSRKDFVRLFLCAFFGVALNMLLFFEGLERTSPIDASLIMITTPILVLILGFLLKEEDLTFNKFAGVLFGTTGAAFLIFLNPNANTESSGFGNLLIFINAASYAVYLVLVRPLMNKYNPVTINLWTFIFGVFMVAPFGNNQLAEARFGELTISLWLVVVFVVVFTTFLAYTLNSWALQYVPSSVVGSYIYLQPVLATFMAVGWGKYNLTWQHIVFALLIFAGVYLVSMKKSSKEISPDTSGEA